MRKVKLCNNKLDDFNNKSMRKINICGNQTNTNSNNEILNGQTWAQFPAVRTFASLLSPSDNVICKQQSVAWHEGF